MWESISIGAAFFFVAAATITAIHFGRKKSHKKQEVPVLVAEENWFCVQTCEEIVRKILAGETLLLKESRRDYWTDQEKKAFQQAAAHINAAGYLVKRTTRT